MKFSLESKMRMWGFLFVVPVIIFFAIFNTYPIINAFFVSFFDYDLLTPKKFIGMGNYIELFNSPLFRKYLFASWYYVLGTCIIIWIISFGLALILRRKFLFRNFFRSIFFMPSIISLIVVSIIWKVMFQLYGPINVVVSPIVGHFINWLTDKNFAMPAIIIMSVWRGTGYYLILFLAGLQAVPEVYYEAAKIDGASWWQQLKHITLPLMKSTIVFVIIISIVIGLKVFEPMYIMTAGGPNDVTKVLTLAIYQTGFLYFKMGKASAMAVIMFVLIMIFTVIQLRIFRTEGEKL